jgi:hypothetical protein
MNDQDLEAFNKWFIGHYLYDYNDLVIPESVMPQKEEWQAAIEYKQKEIDELKFEIMEIKGERNQAEFKLAIAIEAIQFARMVLSDAKLTGAVDDMNNYLSELEASKDNMPEIIKK